MIGKTIFSIEAMVSSLDWIKTGVRCTNCHRVSGVQVVGVCQVYKMSVCVRCTNCQYVSCVQDVIVSRAQVVIVSCVQDVILCQVYKTL